MPCAGDLSRPYHPLRYLMPSSHPLRSHPFLPTSLTDRSLVFTIDLFLEPLQINESKSLSVGLPHCYLLARKSIRCMSKLEPLKEMSMFVFATSIAAVFRRKGKSRCTQCFSSPQFHSVTFSYVSAGCVSKQEALEKKKNKLLFPQATFLHSRSKQHFGGLTIYYSHSENGTYF